MSLPDTSSQIFDWKPSAEPCQALYPASRGPSIFLDKSGRGESLPLPELSRKIEGPLLARYRHSFSLFDRNKTRPKTSKTSE